MTCDGLGFTDTQFRTLVRTQREQQERPMISVTIADGVDLVEVTRTSQTRVEVTLHPKSARHNAASLTFESDEDALRVAKTIAFALQDPGAPILR